MRIITDTASDILESEARAMGVEVVPLGIRFGEQEFSGNSPEAFDAFYQRLMQDDVFPTTSQPSPEQFAQQFACAQANGEEALAITISSCLSGTYNSAMNGLELCGSENAAVFDTQKATVLQRMMVEYAVRMRNEGKNLRQMLPLLENLRSRICGGGYVATLTYLKKGGRIPPSIAALGNLLHMKPILSVENGVLNCVSKKRGEKAASAALLATLAAEELDPDWPVYFGYTGMREPVEAFRHACIEKLGLRNTSVFPVGGTIGAHTGPGAVIVAYVRK